jgi:hypothetical protein
VMGCIAPPDPCPREPTISAASVADDQEAHRIAGELVKLHHDGAISGRPADRDAAFYACLIRDFGATYSGTFRDCVQVPPLKSQ